MNEKITRMDTFEIQEMDAKVKFGIDPLGFLAGQVDMLAEAPDQPGDSGIASELLSEVETTLQLIEQDKSLLLDAQIETIIKAGRESEVSYKIIYGMFKELGFSLETMLDAVEIDSESPVTKMNNLNQEKFLRQVYAE